MRPYQTELVERTREALSKGYRRVIVQLETGGGKTLVMAEIIRRCVARGKSVDVYAHMRDLIYQFSKRLASEQISHSVLMSGVQDKPREPVWLMSKDTVIARLRKNRMTMRSPDLVIVDEGDRATSKWYGSIISQYKCPVLLFTATPCLPGGYGMGGYADFMVLGPKPSELVKQGYLVPCRTFSPPGPDLRGVKFSSDGSASKTVEKRILDGKVIGNVVHDYVDKAYGRPALLFARNIEHSISLMNKFKAENVSAVHLDADTPTIGIGGRQETFDRLCQGDVKVVLTVGLADAGLDYPPISCIILASPDRSLRRYRQRTGRGKRPSPETGKKDCLILDHAGTLHTLGKCDDDIDWVLDGGKRVSTPSRAKNKESLCPKCFLANPGKPCSNCGYEYKAKGRKHKKDVPGLLYEVTETSQTANEMAAMMREETAIRCWKKCLGIAAAKGGTFAMAATIFHTYEKRWPNQCLFLPDVPGQRDWNRRVRDVLPKYSKRTI
jgi:superfamily II DNA or RNA helicase